MKVSMDYSDALSGLQTELQQLVQNADKNVNKYLANIGGVVATETARQSKEFDSDNDFYWSNGTKKSNTHISEDVTYKVGKARKTKTPFVTISGGKKTWPKWIVASDGHVAENGKFIPGNHFVEKSAKASEEKVDALVDDFIKRVITDDGKTN